MKIYHTGYIEVGPFVQGFLGRLSPKAKGEVLGMRLTILRWCACRNNVQLAFFCNLVF